MLEEWYRNVTNFTKVTVYTNFFTKNYTCKKSLAWRTEISVGVLDGLNRSTVNNSNLTPIGRLLLKEYVIKDELSPSITKASGFILSTFKILKMLITFCWFVSQDIFFLYHKMPSTAGSQSFVVRLCRFQKVHPKHNFVTEYRKINHQPVQGLLETHSWRPTNHLKIREI